MEQKELLFPQLSSLPEGATGGFLLSDSLNDDEKYQHLKVFFEFIDKNYSHSHSLLMLKEQIQFEKGSIEPTQILLENGYTWLNNTPTKFHCTHYLKLEMPFEEKVWDGIWSKKMRRNIRHVRKTGFHVVIDDKFEYFDDFVDMQIQMVKKFGVALNKDDLYQILKVFQNKVKLFIGLVDSQPISSQLCYFTPTTVYLSKGPYLPAAREYRNGELPSCAAIKYACENGYKYVEFGVSTSPDLIVYKEKFGATTVPMRMYTKNFSHFKVITNKSYQYLTWGIKKILVK